MCGHKEILQRSALYTTNQPLTNKSLLAFDPAFRKFDEVFESQAPDPQGRPWPPHASVADAVNGEMKACHGEACAKGIDLEVAELVKNWRFKWEHAICGGCSEELALHSFGEYRELVGPHIPLSTRHGASRPGSIGSICFRRSWPRTYTR